MYGRLHRTGCRGAARFRARRVLLHRDWPFRCGFRRSGTHRGPRTLFWMPRRHRRGGIHFGPRSRRRAARASTPSWLSRRGTRLWSGIGGGAGRPDGSWRRRDALREHRVFCGIAGRRCGLGRRRRDRRRGRRQRVHFGAQYRLLVHVVRRHHGVDRRAGPGQRPAHRGRVRRFERSARADARTRDARDFRRRPRERRDDSPVAFHARGHRGRHLPYPGRGDDRVRLVPSRRRRRRTRLAARRVTPPDAIAARNDRGNGAVPLARRRDEPYRPRERRLHRAVERRAPRRLAEVRAARLGAGDPRGPPAPRGSIRPRRESRRGSCFHRGDVQCSTCHNGAKLTNNQPMDVGTGGAFQVPPLVGVGWRTPLMHDGCATTLADRFGACATPQHGSTTLLSARRRTSRTSPHTSRHSKPGCLWHPVGRRSRQPHHGVA